MGNSTKDFLDKLSRKQESDPQKAARQAIARMTQERKMAPVRNAAESALYGGAGFVREPEGTKTPAISAVAGAVGPMGVQKSAQRQLDEYRDSDAHRQAIGEANRRHLENAVKMLFQPGSVSDAPLSLHGIPVDQKERQLQQAAEVEKAREAAEADAAVAQQDMQTLETMTAEELGALDSYRANRRSYNTTQLNPMTDQGFGYLPRGAEAALIEKYGLHRVNELAETRSREENRKLTEAVEKAAAEAARGSFTGESHTRLTPAELEVLDSYIRNQQAYNASQLNPMTDRGFGYLPKGQEAELVRKYGIQAVNEMAESRRREASGGDWRAAAGHSALSVPASVGSGIPAAMTRTLEMGERTGRYQTLDPNSEGDILNTYAGAVRGEVAGNIAGDEYDEQGNQVKEGGTARQLGSYAYQGVMSMADSFGRALLGGGPAGGAGLAATGTFTQTLTEASRRGATPGQAALLATATAGIEHLSEKIPMERIFKAAKSGNTNILLEGFKQAGIEISTEELSLFASYAAEAAVLQEKSSYQTTIRDLVAGGMSYEQAREQANRQIWEEMKQTAWVSGFAGFLGGAGGNIGGSVAQGTEVVGGTGDPSPTEKTGGAAEPVQPEQGAAKGEDKPTGGASEAERQQELLRQAAEPVTATKQPTETSTAVNTDPAQHTPQEQAVIDEYQNAVDDNLVEYVEAVKNNPGQKMPRYPLKDVSDRAAQDIQQLTGVNVSGNKTQIEARMVEHILKDHGENGEADQSMRDVNDIGRIQYVIDNYDTVEHGGTSSAYTQQNSHGRNVQAQTVVFKKKVNGTYFVVEAVPDTKKKTVFIVSAYMSKDGKTETASSPSGDAEASRVTSDNATKSDAVQEGVTQAPAENPSVNHETNAQSALASPSPDSSITEDGHEVNGNMTQTESAPMVDNEEVSSEGGQGTVGAMKSQFPHEIRQSRVYDNTYAYATDPQIRKTGEAALAEDPTIGQYEAISEAESLKEAEQRTRSARERAVEYRRLMKKESWTGADNDTAMKLLTQLRNEGKTEELIALARKQREYATTAGQLIQSFAKYSRADATVAVMDALKELDEMTPGDVMDSVRRAWGKDTQTVQETQAGEQAQPEGEQAPDNMEKWRRALTKELMTIANRIEALPNGDTESMRQIIRELARFRKTTAFAGYSSKLTPIAEKMVSRLDFNTARAIAKNQLAMVPKDFRKRSTSENLKTIRIHNMLSSLVSIDRNLAGNGAGGLADSLSDSFAGRAADTLLSRITGRRTVGNDFVMGREYLKGMAESAEMAALCVELNIPMELGEPGYSTGSTRTHSTQGNPLTRFLSAYEKYMNYALGVTDKAFEGGAKAATSASLERLGDLAGLTEEQREELAGKVGKRRTFKDPGLDGEGRALAQGTKLIKKGLDKVVHVGDFGAGDLLMPFTGVPSEVTQMGIDYTGAGIAEGLGEMISIIRDARNGKTIDPYRQRKAATDFGRGVTGTAMVSLFTLAAAKGILTVTKEEDWDKAALLQSEGMKGAQLNLSALWRGLTGGDTRQQDDDILLSMEFLEPFNMQMHLGWLMSQEANFAEAMKGAIPNGFKAAWSAIQELPMFQTVEDISGILSGLGQVKDEDYAPVKDAAAEFAGNLAGGFIPAWMRQTAQFMDPTYRDTTHSDGAQAAANRILAGLPKVSQSLPVKYDGFGREQRRYDNGWEGFFDTFLNPGDITRATVDPVSSKLHTLSQRTGDDSIYPNYAAPASITVDGEKIAIDGKEMTERYQKTYGETVYSLYSSLMGMEGFDRLTEDQQIQALKDALGYSRTAARAAITDKVAPPEGTPAEIAKSIWEKTVSAPVRSSADDAFDALNAGRSKDAIAGMDEAWESYNKMPKAQKNAMAEGGGRTAALIRAKEAGVSTETFADLYRQYYAIDQQTLSQTEKARQWAAVLERAYESGTIRKRSTINTLKDSLKYYQQFPAETEKFDGMIGAGLDTDQALDIGKLLDGLKPEEGKKQVSDRQKAGAIADMDGLTDEARAAALRVYLGDAQDENLDALMEKGYSTEDYVNIWNLVEEFTSGTGKKSRTVNELARIYGISQAEAKEIYEIFR